MNCHPLNLRMLAYSRSNYCRIAQRPVFLDVGDGETEMTPSNAAIYQTQACTPDSLRTLAGYLELALDEGESVVLMRIGTQVISPRALEQASRHTTRTPKPLLQTAASGSSTPSRPTVKSVNAGSTARK